jgi:hypothetical protein
MPNPDEPVAAKRKSRFIGELKIEDCKLNIQSKIFNNFQGMRICRDAYCVLPLSSSS